MNRRTIVIGFKKPEKRRRGHGRLLPLYFYRLEKKGNNVIVFLMFLIYDVPTTRIYL